MNTETNVNLNVHELGILLSSLQLLSNRDEIQIAKEYGSSPALYNKLYTVYERLDRSSLYQSYDITPSF